MKKGHTNNPNGRPKGRPNKATIEVRVWLAQLIDDNREQIRDDLKKLGPKDRLLILEKFFSYTIPKMESSKADANVNQVQAIGKLIIDGDEITIDYDSV